MQVCTLVSAHQLIGVDSMHSTQILISGFSSQERTGQARRAAAARARSVPKTRAAHRANSYFMELYWKIRSSLYANLLHYKIIQKILVIYYNNST